MDGEAPKSIFLKANFAEVKPVGINIVDFAESILRDHFAKRQDGGMVFENMPNHENTVVSASGFFHFKALLVIQRQRLFDKDSFAGGQRLEAERVVRFSGSGED